MLYNISNPSLTQAIKCGNEDLVIGLLETGYNHITELLNARAQEIHVAENIQNSELSNIDLGEERVTDLRFGWER